MPVAIVAVAVCEPDAVNTLYMLVVGESGAVAIALNPEPGVRLFDEDIPQKAKSAVPVGWMVALTERLEADPVPTGPSMISDPPDVSKQERPQKLPLPVRFAIVLVNDPFVTVRTSNRA